MKKSPIFLLAFLLIFFAFSSAQAQSLENLFSSDDEQKSEENPDQEKPKKPKRTTLLPYIDEGKANPSFRAFRENLLKRIDEKDAEYLLSILDEKLRFSFGGRQEFINFYRLQNEPEKSQIWIELKNVLRLGGIFTPDEGFCASYVTCMWPDDASAPDLGTIISKGAALKSAPADDAATSATLSRNIVKIIFDSKAARAGYAMVQTLDGRKGYVKNNQVRQPTDYRAFFKQKGGKWYMTIYING